MEEEARALGGADLFNRVRNEAVMQRKWPIIMVTLLLSAGALAQDKPIARIDPVPPNPGDPIVKPVFDAIRSRGGEPLNMHRALANAPQVFKAYVDLAIALRTGAVVPRKYRELIIIRTAQKAGGDYEVAQHRPMALSCGLTRAQLDAIATWQNSSEFDARERAILAFAEEMAADKAFRTPHSSRWRSISTRGRSSS